MSPDPVPSMKALGLYRQPENLPAPQLSPRPPFFLADAVAFGTGTSFHSAGAPGHTSGTRAVAGGDLGETRHTAGHQDRIPRVARRAPVHAGRTAGMTGAARSQTGGGPGASRRTPAAKRCAPGMKRCVSGVSQDVSSVARCMEMNDLCCFTSFAIFPFGAVKQNTEKQQKRQK